MISMLLFPLCLFFSLPSISLAQLDTSNCPLLGPDFPAPVDLSRSRPISEAQQLTTTAIQRALLNTTGYGGLDANATSFSLQVYSLHATDPLFTYHFSAPALADPTEGVATVDSNTIYRIASISKLLTVYSYLITAGDASFSDPITKYVPELAQYAETNANEPERDDIDTVHWEDITVGALASQLAGIGRDTFVSPVLEQSYASLGLPPVPLSNASFCGEGLFSQPCDRNGYSNTAFTFLGYALENITGQPLSEIFSSALIDPLGLNATSFGVPASANNSIVPFDSIVSFYAADVYEQAATGGYFSSVNDMTKIGLSILNSTLLTPAQTRNWMKPKSFTSNANFSVGAPWEIVRAPGDRISYLYTKNGNLGLYGSQIVLMPDYDVGFTVLAAGQSDAQSIPVLSDIISGIFYPALEAAAKEEADANYAGTYQDPVGVNSSITIITDDRPGLAIQQWIFNGIDGFAFIRAALQTPDPPAFTLRLYPTGLKTTDRSGRTIRVAWRAVLDIPSLSSSGPFSQSCVSWFAVDALTYGGIGFDEFVFNLGLDGRAVSIEPRLLQQNALQRQQGSGKMI